MINKEIFWETIERNKNNPIDFWDESETMSLEDIFEFNYLSSGYAGTLYYEHKDFMMDMCINYKLVNFVEKELDDGSISCTFGSAFDYLATNIVFRGKELYEAFINEDEEKVKSLLDFMNGRLSDEEVDFMIFDIGRIKVCPVEEYQHMYDDEKVYEKYIDMFFEKYEEYEKNKTMEEK